MLIGNMRCYIEEDMGVEELDEQEELNRIVGDRDSHEDVVF